MVEKASAATAVLDLQAEVMSRALEVLKLSPQQGAKDKDNVALMAPGRAKAPLARSEAPLARSA
jgi:hypothetical protein